MESVSKTTRHKVVATMQDGSVLKGYLETSAPTDLATLLADPYRRFPSALTLADPETGQPVGVDVRHTKAVFFVKDFQGDSRRKTVRFHSNGPVVHGVWVEIRFKDNEVVEGIISNSLHHLLDEGFLLSPSDPDSNNEVMYVMKNCIASYRILGLRTIDQETPVLYEAVGGRNSNL